MQLNQLKNIRVSMPDSVRKKAANDLLFNEQASGAEDIDKNDVMEPSGPDIDKTIRENVLPDTVFDAKYRFTKIESRIALSAFAIIVFVLSAVWASWEQDYAIVGNADIAYYYGLVGGSMMLMILIYALRKRARFMRRIGDIRYWYYFHFMFGVVGPILIVLHTSFEIRSINGGVALFGMLSVVFSGFIGRYIYTRSSYGLRTLEHNLQTVHDQIERGVLNSKLPAVSLIENQIKTFSQQSLVTPNRLIPMLFRLILLKNKARLLNLTVSREVGNVMKTIAHREGWTDVILEQKIEQERRQVKRHLDIVANIATSRAFEKLGAQWRLLHVPVLYLLVLSGLAHVVAVHMY